MPVPLSGFLFDQRVEPPRFDPSPTAMASPESLDSSNQVAARESGLEITARRVMTRSASVDTEASGKEIREEGRQTSALWEALDQMRRDMGSEAEGETGEGDLVASRAKGVVLAISATILATILRVGSLAAMALSSIPLWRRVDPLVIHSLSDEERRELDEKRKAAEREEERGARGISRLLDRRKRPAR